MEFLKTHELELPEMRLVRQLFDISPAVDVSAEIEKQWDRIRTSLPFPDRKDIAVGVGSRGIANLAEVVRAVVAKLKAAGFDPFIIPAINSLTSCGPEDVRAPLAFGSDREALAAVLMTLRPYTNDDVRIVHIQNTLELTQLLVSKGCLPELVHKPGIEIEKDDVDLLFDKNNNLLSRVSAIF